MRLIVGCVQNHHRVECPEFIYVTNGQYKDDSDDNAGTCQLFVRLVHESRGSEFVFLVPSFAECVDDPSRIVTKRFGKMTFL